MVHMMRVAFNQSGLLHREPRRCGLCISIKLLDEGARWLLLLFFLQILFTLSSASQNFFPRPSPRDGSKTPCWSLSRADLSGLSAPPFPPQAPALCAASTCRPQAARRSNKPHLRDERAIHYGITASTKVHCPSSHRSTRMEIQRSREAGEGMLVDANNSFCAQ